MKNIKLLLLVILCAFFICSCSTTIYSTYDELTLYKWSKTDDYGMVVTLCFNDSIGTFSVSAADGTKTEITGNTIGDSKCFTIADTNKKSTYTFEYTVYGNKIDLVYNGATISLDKCKE